MLTFRHSIGPDVRLTFSEKPNLTIRLMLGRNGFRWNSAGRYWSRGKVQGAADIIDALRRLIGPRRPDGACWSCNDPAGFFRQEGAATPVLCDSCHQQARERQENSDRFDMDVEDRMRDQCGL